MKNKINIFINKEIQSFLIELFSDYELCFMKLNEIEENLTTTPISIIFVNNINNFKLFKIRNLNDNCLLLSNLEIKDTDTKSKYIKTPASINYIKNTIENLIENLKVQFHDIHIINEKLTNVKNKSFCYLTKLESEILIYLISEKETTKKYIKHYSRQVCNAASATLFWSAVIALVYANILYTNVYSNEQSFDK